ncbi:MAG: uracil-DNA glycosylase [Bacteroidia bacterium]|nr:uracil-DNA glycosylase [Bacteroidia bacterium]
MSTTHPADSVSIESGWKQALYDDFAKLSFQQLKTFLKEEASSGKFIYPPGKLIFNAFNTTPFDSVKVVILGQDPYHGPGQAHGLSFSVPEGVAIPPSLRNMYQELQQDVGLTIPAHGNLQKWAEQGVLLLNSMLTVEAGQPGSHQGKGWEEFTTAAMYALSQQKSGVVFMLWGKYAQEKGAIIDANRHLVLKAAHPSPFSAYRGFMGCGHFSQANAYLVSQGKSPIDWQI